MLVSDAPRLGFRALQVVADLCAAAHRHGRAASVSLLELIPHAERLPGTSGEWLNHLIERQSARLERGEDLSLLDGLMIAATQPDHDPSSFVCATAILLANRIQNGLGDDALGSFWDTYSGLYANLDPLDRAAIIQGYLEGARLGRVKMSSEPVPPHARLTDRTETLHADLSALARRDSKALSTAVFERLDSVSGALARQHLQALLAGKIREPLTGDSMLFEPLLSFASDARHPTNTAATAVLLAEAVRKHDREGWFGVTLWPEMADEWLSLEPGARRTILAGMRHLFEVDQTWAPEQVRCSHSGNDRFMLFPVLDGTQVRGFSDVRVE